MKHLIPFRIRVEKNVVTRVTRVLKGHGQINVQVGQQVTPAEIIGLATLSGGFRVINLATELQVAPPGVEQYLLKKLGQRIYKGELLAYKKGGLLVQKKIITATADGVLDSFNTKTGELRIAFIPKQITLPAGVYGIVDYVDKERGMVVIRTEVNSIHGIFGSGKPRDGVLHVLGKRDSLIEKNAIRESNEGQILVGGSLFFREAISAAISAGVRGIITGGVNAGDFRRMASGHFIPDKLDNNDFGVSFVACEGFGSAPLGSDIFEIFKQYEAKFVFINGNKAVVNLPSFSANSLFRVRSTVLPPVQKGADSRHIDYIRENVELSIGAAVRVTGNSYLAEQGRVVAINQASSLLASGIKDYLVTVETARRKIQVPVANLEIIL